MTSGAENGPGEVTLTTVGDCPSSETLAAYLDRVLSQEERDAVELHLVSCDDCREAMSESSLAQAEPQPAVDPVPFPAPAPTLSRAARPWLWPTVGLLAAAAVALAVAVPSYFRSKNIESRPELAELVAAVGPHRPFQPRLTGGFAYGPLAPVMRSGQSDAIAVSPEIRLAAARLAQAYETSPNTRTKAAHAAGELLLGRYDSSISLLEEVTREAPSVAEYWNDLAAAYIVKSATTGEPQAALNGLGAAERALTLRPRFPEAQFNVAVAVETRSSLGANGSPQLERQSGIAPQPPEAQAAWLAAAEGQTNSEWKAAALAQAQRRQR